MAIQLSLAMIQNLSFTKETYPNFQACYYPKQDFCVQKTVQLETIVTVSIPAPFQQLFHYLFFIRHDSIQFSIGEIESRT